MRVAARQAGFAQNKPTSAVVRSSVESYIPAIGIDTPRKCRFPGRERNINRSWSASADGNINEVGTCMKRAEAYMSEADALLKSYKQQTRRA